MIVSALSSTFDQNFTGNMREWRRREHSLVKTGLHQRKNFQPPPPKQNKVFWPLNFRPCLNPGSALHVCSPTGYFLRKVLREKKNALRTGPPDNFQGCKLSPQKLNHEPCLFFFLSCCQSLLLNCLKYLKMFAIMKI